MIGVESISGAAFQWSGACMANAGIPDESRESE